MYLLASKRIHRKTKAQIVVFYSYFLWPVSTLISLCLDTRYHRKRIIISFKALNSCIECFTWSFPFQFYILTKDLRLEDPEWVEARPISIYNKVGKNLDSCHQPQNKSLLPALSPTRFLGSLKRQLCVQHDLQVNCEARSLHLLPVQHFSSL